MTIRPATVKDMWGITALALLLWPDHDTQPLYEEMLACLHDADSALFVAQDDKNLVGFAQCSLRYDYVEGTQTSPVGYLEGIFVRDECRRGHVASSLAHACMDWARIRGCKEFASDCQLDNRLSIAFHRGIGFAEANRLVCFVHKL